MTQVRRTRKKREVQFRKLLVSLPLRSSVSKNIRRQNPASISFCQQSDSYKCTCHMQCVCTDRSEVIPEITIQTVVYLVGYFTTLNQMSMMRTYMEQCFIGSVTIILLIRKFDIILKLKYLSPLLIITEDNHFSLFRATSIKFRHPLLH
jgi:hypothetical protein